MALIVCPECSREISDKATACPHCGCPVSIPTRTAAPKQPPVYAKSTLKQHLSALGIVFAVASVIAIVAYSKHWYGEYEKRAAEEIAAQNVRTRAKMMAAIEAAKTPEQKAADAKDRAAKKEAADKAKAEEAAAAAKEQARRNSFDPVLAGASTSIHVISWEKGGFDTVMLISARLTNHHSRAVKDIEVRCETTGNSGTRLNRRSRVVYESIPAGKSTTIRNFSMGFIDPQSQRAWCEIGRVKVD